MFEVNQELAGERFCAAWRAAGQHLQHRGEGSVNWLRAELNPPLAEHLSFRLGNQLFFVFIEVPGIDGPSSKDLFLQVAAEAAAWPVVLLMEPVGSEFQPVYGGWGLRDARNDRTVDPPSLVSDELIEMSDWEVHDFAIQIVTSQIEKSSGAVSSKQSSLHIDPSIWFSDKHGPAYVVVRSGRFPQTEAAMPTNLSAIMASCAKVSHRGFFASVVIANAEQQRAAASRGAVPLYRGHGMVVRFTGLEALQHSNKSTMAALGNSGSLDPKHEALEQEAIDYDIRGSRHWSDLTGPEQDDYIWACFEGESTRAEAEKSLRLFDRIAATVADNVLGPFRQLDITEGRAHYQPENAARVERVLSLRMTALRGTPLGDLLSAALNRRRSPRDEVSYADDPKLRFEYLDFRRTPGLEIMAEESFGGYVGIDPYRGKWNDWTALELQQAREIQLLRGKDAIRMSELPAPQLSTSRPLQQSGGDLRRQNEVPPKPTPSVRLSAESVAGGMIRKCGVGLCRVLQGVITLGVMLVVPVGWFFFGWIGPVEARLGNFFVWQVADVVLWMLASMAAMFATTGLEKMVRRHSGAA